MAKRKGLSASIQKKKEVDPAEIEKMVAQIHPPKTVKVQDDDPEIKTSFGLPSSLFKQVKIHCAMEGIKFKEYINELIKKDLTK